MSKPLTPHDPKGVIAFDQTGKILWQGGNTVPADGTTGYAVGAEFTKSNGTTIFGTSYFNTGTTTSCAFRASHGRSAFVEVAASTAITGTNEVETAFDQTYTLPANVLNPGTRIRVRAQGIHTATTGSETHTMALKIGSVAIASKASIDPANNDVFYFDFEIVCRTAGASGTLVAAGVAAFGASGIGAALAYNKASTAIDTTVANIIGIYITRQASATDADSARLDILSVDVIG